MKKQSVISNLTFILMMGLTLATTQSHAALSVKSTGITAIQNGGIVYERVLNPYISISTDQRAVGNTYAVRDCNGRIVRTGVVSSSQTFSLPTAKLGPGSYSVYIGGYLLQQFTVK
jgi:hypothetical protein